MRAPEFLEQAQAWVEPALARWLPAADAPPQVLHAAMRHAVFPGGKRLRPALCFAACCAAGGKPEAALAPAAAVEVLHSYTLIHDDLPCMDDDDERRGRPSVHRAYGEATALLAGDALHALAFELLAREGSIAPDARAAALAELAAASSALVSGQWDDLHFSPATHAKEGAHTSDAARAKSGAHATHAESVAHANDTAHTSDAARLESIHRRKTAALFAASLSLGARFGGADAARAAELHALGEELGVAFQLADDWLDAQRDGASGALSAVTVLGEARARERAEALLANALARVADWGARADALRALADFCVRRKL